MKDKDVIGMIKQLADLNNIDDTELMAGCFGVALSLLFVYQHEKGLKRCQDMLSTMTELAWKEWGVE